jgi:hypothetical protein
MTLMTGLGTLRRVSPKVSRLRQKHRDQDSAECAGASQNGNPAKHHHGYHFKLPIERDIGACRTDTSSQEGGGQTCQKARHREEEKANALVRYADETRGDRITSVGLEPPSPGGKMKNHSKDRCQQRRDRPVALGTDRAGRDSEISGITR